ncbi:MAG: c-type cytochrome [Ignavibacteriales bacterium]|nr:c-type cytochrome [Ignavibacteriales bacterium]
MDHKTPNNKLAFVKLDKLFISLSGIALLALTVWIFYGYFFPSWKGYQSEFRDLVTEKFGEARAAVVPQGLQQVYVKELNIADRCVTCHQAVQWKGLENAPEPFRTHPKDILAKHPIEKYGCTTCHGGQGYATDLHSAHGLTEHWEEPLFGKELGEFYVVSNRSALMQMTCNACHRYDKETPGVDYINRAKELVREKGCRACHVISGRGGTVGPDLTLEGEKSAEQFSYDRIKGLQTTFTWHVTHFKNPKELVPETVMPNFGLSSQDAQSLAMLVMSWKKPRVPVEYIPHNNFKDIPSAEEKEKEERMSKGPGAFFVKHNCFVCHSVSTLGIEAAAQIGPDLALAVEDVQARFGRQLEDFLMKPTGTMDVVLSTMIPLTTEERQEAIGKLHTAYELKQKERKAKK